MSQQVAAVQAAVVATINTLGVTLVDSGFELITASPIPDDEIAAILARVVEGGTVTPTEQVAAVSKAIWDADDMAAKPDFAWGETTRASYDRMAQAAIDALPDRWGEGYRAGVIEGMYRAARHAQDHARATELGIPYEQGLPK